MKKKNRHLVSWLILAGAIGYLFLPVDLIPDVPFIGLIDDAVIFIVAKLINDKLK